MVDDSSVTPHDPEKTKGQRFLANPEYLVGAHGLEPWTR